MTRVHDRGGWSGAGSINRAEHELSWWEKRTDALVTLLTGTKRVMRVDELRRAIEGMDPTEYERCAYYERWISALEILMIEKGILTREEIEQKVKELDARG